MADAALPLHWARGGGGRPRGGARPRGGGGGVLTSRIGWPVKPSPASAIIAVGMPATSQVTRKPSRSSIARCSAAERCSPYASSGVSHTRSASAV